MTVSNNLSVSVAQPGHDVLRPPLREDGLGDGLLLDAAPSWGCSNSVAKPWDMFGKQLKNSANIFCD